MKGSQNHGVPQGRRRLCKLELRGIIGATCCLSFQRLITSFLLTCPGPTGPDGFHSAQYAPCSGHNGDPSDSMVPREASKRCQIGSSENLRVLDTAVYQPADTDPCSLAESANRRRQKAAKRSPREIVTPRLATRTPPPTDQRTATLTSWRTP